MGVANCRFTLTPLNSTLILILFFFSNIFKRFFFPIILTAPAAIGASFSLILPRHIFKVKGQGLFNIYMEFLIRRSKLPTIIFLRESIIAATLMFSVLHSCIMFGILKACSTNFWFSTFKVNKGNQNFNDHKCQKIHGKSSCSSYLISVRRITNSI